MLLHSVMLPPAGLAEMLIVAQGWTEARVAAPMFAALREAVPDWCESAKDERIIAKRLVAWHCRSRSRARAFRDTLEFWWSYWNLDVDLHGWHQRLNLPAILYHVAQDCDPKGHCDPLWQNERLYVCLVEHRVRALLGAPLSLSMDEMRRHYDRQRWAAAAVLARRRANFATGAVWEYLGGQWWDVVARAEASN